MKHSYEDEWTVRQIIDALSALPEASKDKKLSCTAEAGYAKTAVYGILEETTTEVVLDGW